MRRRTRIHLPVGAPPLQRAARRRYRKEVVDPFSGGRHATSSLLWPTPDPSDDTRPDGDRGLRGDHNSGWHRGLLLATTVVGATTSSPAVTGGGEVTTLVENSTTVSGATPTSTMTSGSVPASGSTPTSDSTDDSGPDAGTTSTDSAGLPAPITPEEIKLVLQSAGMGSPDQLTIYQYKNFVHYAAAYVMAADENVYVVLFNDETGGWVALDMITGLDWPAMQAELRLKGAPEDLIEWANPGDQ